LSFFFVNDFPGADGQLSQKSAEDVKVEQKRNEVVPGHDFAVVRPPPEEEDEPVASTSGSYSSEDTTDHRSSGLREG